MLAMFNLVYTLVSTPAGSLSDKVGRRNIIIGGWVVYALVYLGFGLASAAWQVWLLYIVYGLYYGMAYGTTKAMVADLVSSELRGTAYGTYNAILGIIDFPLRSSRACSAGRRRLDGLWSIRAPYCLGQLWLGCPGDVILWKPKPRRERLYLINVTIAS